MSVKRIAIVGSGGSGKSTLARQLGEIFELPIIHLDALHWKPGWVEPSKEEWLNIVTQATHKEAWVIDGNYGGTLNLRLKAADIVVFLDLPRLLCSRRVIERWLQYAGRTRSDMGTDCPEKMDWEFLKWIWNYPRANRPGLLEKLGAVQAEKRVIRLTSPQEVADFLETIRLIEKYNLL